MVGSQFKPNEVTFSWSAPFTIEGVPILGYESYVSMISDSDDSIIYKNHHYLNDTEFNVAKPKSNSSCIYINVSVLATNSAGKGTVVNHVFYFRESKCILFINYTPVVFNANVHDMCTYAVPYKFMSLNLFSLVLSTI